MALAYRRGRRPLAQSNRLNRGPIFFETTSETRMCLIRPHIFRRASCSRYVPHRLHSRRLCCSARTASPRRFLPGRDQDCELIAPACKLIASQPADLLYLWRREPSRRRFVIPTPVHRCVSMIRSTNLPLQMHLNTTRALPLITSTGHRAVH
jgi:hypothetical protein